MRECTLWWKSSSGQRRQPVQLCISLNRLFPFVWCPWSGGLGRFFFFFLFLSFFFNNLLSSSLWRVIEKGGTGSARERKNIEQYGEMLMKPSWGLCRWVWWNEASVVWRAHPKGGLPSFSSPSHPVHPPLLTPPSLPPSLLRIFWEPVPGWHRWVRQHTLQKWRQVYRRAQYVHLPMHWGYWDQLLNTFYFSFQMK